MSGGHKLVSGISSDEELLANLKSNCVPLEIMEMTKDNYPEFLAKRRILMAEKIKQYYFSL